ncbi:MAG: 30S ribosomal protein S20 [Calditrichia bacterium]
MAHHKSTIKRIKLSEKQRQRNIAYRTMLKTAIRRVEEAKDKEEGATALVNAHSVIDKLAIKGIIPANRAANKKSRLSRFVSRIA